MQGQYSLRSPAVKRLMKEAQELNQPTEQYHAHPLEDNLFEWHFTIRGPVDSDFNGGVYHGRIILPPEYPMKPPSIMLLTPNGRFEIFTKICLSISGHHPESWQPSWSIRTALLAIIGFMPTHGGGAIGSLDYSTEERKVLAKKSQDYKCPQCGPVQDILKPVTDASKADSEEAKELASQIDFKGEKKKDEEGAQTESSSGVTTPEASNYSSTSSSASNSPAQPGPWSAFYGAQPTMPPFASTAFRFPFVPPSSISSNAQTFQRPPMVPFAQMAAMHATWQQMRGQLPNYMQGGAFPPSGWPGTRAPAVTMPSSTSHATTVTSMASENTSSSSTTPCTPSSSSADVTSSSSSAGVTSSSSSAGVTSSSSSAGVTSSSSSAGVTSSTQPTTSTSTTAEASTSSSTGVRQRSAAASRPAVSVRHTTEPAALPQRPRQPQSNLLSTVVMYMIGLVICLLLIRRLYIMDIIKFDQEGEFD